MKNSDVKINSLDDVKKYVTGLVRGDIITEQLKSQGSIGKYEIVSDDILNVRKLFKKRVQTIVTSLIAAKYIAKENGLDPNQKHEVRKLINQMAEDKCIIISTHILEEVEAVCTRTIIIARGKILADSTPKELKEEHKLSLDKVFRKITTSHNKSKK